MAEALRDPQNGQFTNVPDKAGMTRESTGTQNDKRESSSFGMGSFLWANGGTLDNPMRFPGYGSLYTGSYETYRWMLQHPIIRLVRSIAVSPIGVSTWEYEKQNDEVEDEWRELIRGVFDPIRSDLLNDFFVRGRDYGWAPGEPIWDMIDDHLIITRVKPLMPDYTEVLQDKHGNFTGLRNNVNIDAKSYVDLNGPFKAWKYSYDSECGYHYGRSWLENVRMTAWRDWLDCAQQLQKLGAKISGIVSIIISPAGSFPTGDPSKPTMTYRENAVETIKALANGAAGVWFPSLALSVDSKGSLDALKLLGELASKSLTSITPLDFGSCSPAILGILDRMKHNEELMFAGGLRPSRTGLEGSHGTKAEAGVHTDTGTTNSELDDTDFARKLQPLVDAVLVANYGQKAKGKIRINPPSLVDRQTAMLKALLLAGIQVPEFAQEFFSSVNVDSMVKTLGIQKVKDFDPKKLIPPTPPAPVTGPGQKPNPVKNPEPQGGRPTDK